MGDFKTMRLQHDRRASFHIPLRQSIFIVVICYDVEVHENTRGEYIPQHITFISTYVSLENHLLFYNLCKLLTNSTMVYNMNI